MSTWLPSLNALRAFDAVARHLSYSKASEELSVTPAAVKQLVQKLEESVGSQLVRRHGRGVALTAEGLESLADLQMGFRHINAAVTKMRQVGQRKTLTITAEPSFAMTWLISRISEFKAEYPETDVLIDSSLRVIDLHREPVDIAIRYGVQPTKDLVFHRLFDDETIAVCSPALAKGPPALSTLADLENVPLIHIEITGIEWGSSAYSKLFRWESWLASVGVQDLKPGGGLRFSEYSTAVQAAIAGQGVVLGSWPLVKDAIRAGLLVSPFKERATSEIGYDLVTTQENLSKPEVSAFASWIKEKAHQEAVELD